MKTTIPVVALALTSIGAASAVAAAWNSFERLPDAAPVRVLVDDKPRTYFKLTDSRALVVPVEGPTRLRITTRAMLPAGSKSVVIYQLRASEQGRLVDQLSTETSAAPDAKAAGIPFALGKGRRMSFVVPAGSHRVALELSGTSAVLVRVQQAAAAGGETPTVSLTPVSASRSVSVSEGEKVIPYYTARAGQPVRLRVVGPTTLELLTRLDFDATMRGTIPYRLRIVEKQRTLRDVELRTSKATAATYVNLSDRVPSKFERMTIAIPGGLHEIAIQLIRPAHGAAEIHARIPQPSVGNEE